MCKENFTIFEKLYSDFLEEKRPHEVDQNGIQYIFRFPNKKGLSCIKTSFSYGGSNGLWEIALLAKDCGVIYDDDKLQDVLGYLEENDVCKYLEYVKEFYWPDKCDHCKKKFYVEAGHIKLCWRDKWFCDECCRDKENFTSGYNLNDIYKLHDRLRDMRDGYDYYRSDYFVRWPVSLKVISVDTCKETQCELCRYEDDRIVTGCTCNEHFYQNRIHPDQWPF